MSQEIIPAPVAPVETAPAPAPRETADILNRKGEKVGAKLAFLETPEGEIKSYSETKGALKLLHPTWTTKEIKTEAERLHQSDKKQTELAWLRVDALKALARAEGQLPDSGMYRKNAKGEISFSVKCRIPGAGNGAAPKEAEIAAKHAAELKAQEDAHKKQVSALEEASAKQAKQLEELKAALAALTPKKKK